MAGLGWQVTATDVSGVALERATAHAPPELARRISWQRVDLTTWKPAHPGYDLVSAQFVLHFPAALHHERDLLFARLGEAVAPGGCPIVVGHHFLDTRTSVHRPKDSSLYLTADDLAAQLDPGSWTVHTAEVQPRQATDPDGIEVTLRDAVLRAQRR
jgi:2-polyprenyl-3-methyl-5-hydroxy-6-metoxy-1,4-benzoquinol methylase